MELAVVSNGWGIRDFEVFNSDPFRLCVCERENPICAFLLLNLTVTCAFYEDRTQLAGNSQPPNFYSFLRNLQTVL